MTVSRSTLSEPLSVYLDLLRVGAALAVLAGHVESTFGIDLGLLGDHPSEAVAVFFVLSGFLIANAADRPDLDWRRFLSARLARLYSVVLVVVPFGLALDWLGATINPAHYAALPSTDPLDLLRILTFTNEVWFSHIFPGSNEPYWSLGFEAPYYLLFGLALLLRGRLRTISVTLWIVLVGPKIALYAPLWLIGVATHRLVTSSLLADRISSGLAWPLCAVSALAYILLRYPLFHSAPGIFHFDAWRSVLESALYFHLIGLTVALSIIAVSRLDPSASPNTALAAFIHYAAGATFTLYLCHLPLLNVMLALYPQAHGNALLALASGSAVLVAAFLLAELGERRKSGFRRFTDLILGLRPLPASPVTRPNLR